MLPFGGLVDEKNPGRLFIVFLALPFAAFAEKPRISIYDYRVSSDNPKYKFLGKGLAELLAVELSKSPDIILIEREKRAEIAKEIAVSLSDMSDLSTQIRIGRLLAAKYFVFGEVIDLGDTLVISLSLTDLETGQIVLKEKLEAKLVNYDFISAYFTRVILSFLNAQVAPTTVAKAETKETKPEIAVLTISTAIDLYDKKEEKAAKAELDKAKSLDPKNETVDKYLRKLNPASPSFRVEIEKYSPTYNPAVLGTVKSDGFYAWMSTASFERMGQMPLIDVGNGIGVEEKGVTSRIDYLLPLGERFGLGIEFVVANMDNKLNTGAYPFDYFNNTLGVFDFNTLMNNLGGNLLLGWAVHDNISIGLAGSFFNTNDQQNQNLVPVPRPISNTFNFAVTAGLLFHFLDDNLTIDLQGTYTSMTEAYLEYDAAVVRDSALPLVFELNATGALLDKRLFIGLKGIASLYHDVRSGHMLRAIPIVEAWLFDWLAVRAGGEYSHFQVKDKWTFGYGFLAGITIKVWKLSIMFNYTYRLKPITTVPGYAVPDSMILFGLSFDEVFVSR